MSCWHYFRLAVALRSIFLGPRLTSRAIFIVGQTRAYVRCVFLSFNSLNDGFCLAIFDLGLGDVLSVRVAGNITTEEVIGSIEFAAISVGVKLVAVVGHTRSNAIESSVTNYCYPDQSPVPECVHARSILREVSKVIDEDDCRGVASSTIESRQEIVDSVARRNVVRVVRKLLEGSKALTGQVQEQRLGVVGMMYDVVSGEVHVIDETRFGV